MLETRVSHKPQNLNYELMRNFDPKIMKWEKGVNQKMDSRKVKQGYEDDNQSLSDN
jgi:hypothetical protein